MLTRRQLLLTGLPALLPAQETPCEIASGAETRFQSGDFRDAVQLLEAEVKRHNNLSPRETARLRMVLGRYQFRASVLADAEKTLKSAIESPDIDPVSGAIARRYLLEVYFAWEKKVDRASLLPFYQQSLELLKAVGGEEYACTLLFGLIFEPREFDRQIEQIIQVLGPKETPTLARILLVKASNRLARQDFVEARTLFDQSELVAAHTLPEHHPERYTAALRRAALLIENKVFDRAGAILLPALAAKVAKLGDTHFEVLNARFTLATMRHWQGCAQEAEVLLKQLIASATAYGDDNVKLARFRARLALLYQERERFDESDALHRKALEVLEVFYKSDQKALVGYLHNQAVLCEVQGHHGTARELLLRCLNIIGKDPHRDLGSVRQLLAIVHWKDSRISEAIPYFELGAADNDARLERVLSTASEEEKRDYLAGLQNLTNMIRSFHAFGAPEDREAFALAFNNVQQRNGRVLETVLEETALLRRGTSQETRQQLEEIVSLRNHRARLSINAMVRKDAGADLAARSQALLEQQARLEQSFMRKMPRPAQGSQTVEAAGVARKLPPDSVFIQYVYFHRFDPRAERFRDRWSGEHYGAYLVFPGGTSQFRYIGDASIIDKQSLRFREALGQPQWTKDAGELAESLYRALIAPLEGVLGKASHLIVAPDGKLNLIPFAALGKLHGPRLLSRYTISYCSSGREVARWNDHPADGKDVVVFANPDFGAVDESRPFQARPLAGTQREANSIRRLYPNATIHTGADASKAQVSAVASPRILHLATHGYLFANDLPQLKGSRGLDLVIDGAKSLRPARPCSNPGSPIADNNPLWRSVLIFSGANRPPTEEDNGILTATEASSLALSGTDLVVASACNSGEGSVDVGEGIYGLRRAFALAGARSQVLTLWSINDTTSADLMAHFYSEIKRLPRAAALRRAQLEIAKSHGPYHWAAFILSGEPGDLRL